jgi:predicted SprT family Zn-dependent metalloprotease
MDLSAAHSLIWKAMLDHKLFDLGWSFEWDHAKTRSGQCRFADRTISMSKHYAIMEEESEIRDTILHEIAHVLVGPGHHHDYVWRLKAREIGAKPLRCSQSEKRVPGNYIGKCAGCGVEVHRYKKPRMLNVPGWYQHTACKRMGKESKIEWTVK